MRCRHPSKLIGQSPEQIGQRDRVGMKDGTTKIVIRQEQAPLPFDRLKEPLLVFSFVLALTAFSTNALAQNNIMVLTPTTDSCLSYTQAMEANDLILTEGLNGWALGYLSGVAQGTGIDILRDAAAPDLFRQLYLVCKAQPRQLLSVALEGIARNLIAARRH